MPTGPFSFAVEQHHDHCFIKHGSAAEAAALFPQHQIRCSKKALSLTLSAFCGCGTRIRTATNRFRDCRATLTQFRNVPNGTGIILPTILRFVNSFSKKTADIYDKEKHPGFFPGCFPPACPARNRGTAEKRRIRALTEGCSSRKPRSSS